MSAPLSSSSEPGAAASPAAGRSPRVATVRPAGSAAEAPAVKASPVPTRSIVLLAIASFVSGATVRVADPLLPDIGRDFSVSTGDAAAVVAAFSVSYGLLQIFYGPLGDRFGKYRLVATATFLSALGVAVCAFSPSLQLLTLARLVSGATAAAIIPMSMAWIGDVVPYEQRQPVLAQFLAGQILGLVFGQAAGGVLSEFLGWRQVFGVLALLFVLAGAALVLEIRRPGHPRPRLAKGLDFGAAMLQMAGLLRQRWPRTILLAVFLEGALTFGAYAFVGSEMQHRFGIGPGTAGAILAVFGAGGLAYAFLSRRLVAWLGERGLVLWGGLTIAASFVILAAMETLWLAPLGTALCGLGFYMLHNTLQTNATQMAPDARGSAVSLFAAGLFLGQTAGVAVTSRIFDLYGGRPALILAAVLVPLLAVWFASRLRTKPIEQTATG